MTEYIASLLWGLVVMFSFFGWGAGFVRVVGDFEERPSKYLSEYFAYKATLGMALLVVLGGVLNLLGVISPALCVAIVVGGAGWAAKEIFCYYKNPPKKKQKAREGKYQHVQLFFTTVLWVLVIFAASLYYLKSGWAAGKFNLYDDLQAYMAFPHKMLQNGGLGVDPFSERRLESSLGGQYFLHTLFLAVLGNESLKILDAGVALLLLVSMAYGICRRQGIPTLCILLLLLTIICFRYDVPNLTAGRTSYLINLCIFNLLLWMNPCAKNLFKRATTLALVLATACALKSTNIPALGLLLSSYYIGFLFFNKKDRKLISQYAVLTGFLMLVFLLPWMVSLYLSSGTFLCPFLGLGYSGLRYYDDFYTIGAYEVGFDTIYGALEKCLWLLYVPIAFGCVLAFKTGGITRKKIPILIAIIITVLGTNIVFGWMHRYHESATYPGAIIILLWGISLFFQKRQNKSLKMGFKKKTFFTLVLFFVWLAAHNILSLQKIVALAIPNIVDGIAEKNLDTEQEIVSYRHLFDIIPKGEIILARLDKPYLLDFTKHKVWLNDWPGGASPPPGLPYKQKDGEALASYLLSKNVRYLAYSYANEANYSSRYRFAARLSNKSAWGRSAALHTYDYHDTVMNLSRKRVHVYDDSKIFILDLVAVVGSEESL